jgi:hypothetical protein
MIFCILNIKKRTQNRIENIKMNFYEKATIDFMFIAFVIDGTEA